MHACIQLRYIAIHYIALHTISTYMDTHAYIHDMAWHYINNYIQLQYIMLHSITLHNYNITLHDIALFTLHDIPLHYITLHTQLQANTHGCTYQGPGPVLSVRTLGMCSHSKRNKGDSCIHCIAFRVAMDGPVAKGSLYFARRLPWQSQDLVAWDLCEASVHLHWRKWSTWEHVNLQRPLLHNRKKQSETHVTSQNLPGCACSEMRSRRASIRWEISVTCQPCGCKSRTEPQGEKGALLHCLRQRPGNVILMSGQNSFN